MSAQTAEKKHPDTDAMWVIRTFGQHLYAATTIKDPEQKPKTVCIIDIGSNSLKSTIFDCSVFPPAVLAKYDKVLGLAQGMAPNDPAPQLHEKGSARLFNKALPKVREQIAEHQADTVAVLCTEAVRSVQKFDPSTIDAFNGRAAAILGIPAKAINVISERMEAQLAAKAVIYGEVRDGFAVTAGGGSTEIAEIKYGHSHPRHQATLRFGARTLSAQPHARRIIDDGLNHSHWFAARRRPHHAGHPFPNGHQIPHPLPKLEDGHDRERSLILQGGSFRFIGRVLAKRIYNIDYDSDMPFGGYSFTWNPKLKQELNHLRGSNFDKLENDFLREEVRRTRKMSEKQLSKWKRGKDYEAFTESDRYKLWHKRVGVRADFAKAAVEIILAADDRVRSRTVTFVPQSMREGALKHAHLV